ncbi:MAG TPA: polysaccharide deacetylase family protein [Elusimicrobiota bacterium]|jgi:peptidoglycan/xylan/chitin deacetylase (PgdA/CDA1 family)|nr:polysaccharide deacetylase family protein [Elusimicrobiota bacterium]
MIAEASALAAAAVAGASARWNWWRPIVADGLPAPMYHKIGDAPPGSRLAKLWVSAADFRAQLEHLRDDGYTAIGLADWRDAETGLKPLPDKPVLLTFDDGFMNNYEAAYPLLREFGMKGVIFLVYEAVGRHNGWENPALEPWLKMLTWGQIKEMQDSGVIEFGSHTMRHRSLAETPLEEVRWEAVESKARLEDKLGREVLGFAYPYGAGALLPEVRAAVLGAGYRFDFSIKQGITRLPWQRDLAPVRRLLIRGDDAPLDFRLNLTRGRARF